MTAAIDVQKAGSVLFALLNKVESEEVADDQRISPHLWVLAAEMALDSNRPDLAAQCIRYYHRTPSARNQFFCRSELVTARIKALDARNLFGAERVNTLLRALRHVVKAVIVAQEDSSHRFLLYNSSVIFFRLCTPLLREGLRHHLVQSLHTISQALEESKDEDVQWRIRILALLGSCQSDAKQIDEAIRTLQKGYQLASREAPSLKKALYRMVVNTASRKSDAVGRVKNEAQADPELRASFLLESVRGGATSQISAIEKDINDARGLMIQLSKKSKVAADNLAADIASVAIQHKLLDIAQECGTRATQSSSLIARVRGEFVLIALELRKKSPDPESLSEPSIRARIEAGVKTEKTFSYAVRTKEVEAIEEGASLVWAICLPLLQDNLRHHAGRLLDLATQALSDVESSLVDFRAMLHHEAARCDMIAELHAKARSHVEAGIQLDAGSAAVRAGLEVLRERLSILSQLYHPPETPKDACRMLIEQARETKDGKLCNAILDRACQALQTATSQAQSRVSIIPTRESDGDNVDDALALAAAMGTESIDEAAEMANLQEILLLWGSLARLSWQHKGIGVARSASRSFSQLHQSIIENYKDSTLTSNKEIQQVFAESCFIEAETYAAELRAMNEPSISIDSSFDGIIGKQSEEDTKSEKIDRHTVPASAGIGDLGPNELRNQVIRCLVTGANAASRVGEAWLVQNSAIYLYNHHLDAFQGHIFAPLAGPFKRILHHVNALNSQQDAGLACQASAVLAAALEQSWLLRKNLVPEWLEDVGMRSLYDEPPTSDPQSSELKQAEEFCRAAAALPAPPLAKRAVLERLGRVLRLRGVPAAQVPSQVLSSSGQDRKTAQGEKDSFVIGTGCIDASRSMRLSKTRDKTTEITNGGGARIAAAKQPLPPSTVKECAELLRKAYDALLSLMGMSDNISASQSDVGKPPKVSLLVGTSLWGSAALEASRIGDHALASDCANHCLKITEDTSAKNYGRKFAKSAEKIMEKKLVSRWYSVSELCLGIASAATIEEGGGARQDISFQDKRRIEAVRHFVAAAGHGKDADIPLLAVIAARRAWNAGTPLMGITTTRKILLYPMYTLAHFVAWAFRQLKVFESEMGLVDQDEDLDDEGGIAQGEGDEDEKKDAEAEFLVGLYTLLLDCLADNGEWGRGAEICGEAFALLPRKYHAQLWQARAEFEGRAKRQQQADEENELGGIQHRKFLEAASASGTGSGMGTGLSPEMEHHVRSLPDDVQMRVWLAHARAAPHRLQQLHSYQKALKLCGTRRKLDKVDVLCEYSAFLLAGGAPRDAEDALLLASDVLGSFEVASIAQPDHGDIGDDGRTVYSSFAAGTRRARGATSRRQATSRSNAGAMTPGRPSSRALQFGMPSSRPGSASSYRTSRAGGTSPTPSMITQGLTREGRSASIQIVLSLARVHILLSQIPCRPRDRLRRLLAAVHFCERAMRVAVERVERMQLNRPASASPDSGDSPAVLSLPVWPHEYLEWEPSENVSKLVAGDASPRAACSLSAMCRTLEVLVDGLVDSDLHIHTGPVIALLQALAYRESDLLSLIHLKAARILSALGRQAAAQRHRRDAAVVAPVSIRRKQANDLQRRTEQAVKEHQAQGWEQDQNKETDSTKPSTLNMNPSDPFDTRPRSAPELWIQIAGELIEMGEIHIAKEYLSDALPIVRWTSAIDHRPLSYCLLHQAKICSLEGLPSKAVLLAQEAFESGPFHSLDFLTEGNLAMSGFLTSAGRGPDAIALLKNAVVAFKGYSTKYKGVVPEMERFCAILESRTALLMGRLAAIKSETTTLGTSEIEDLIHEAMQLHGSAIHRYSGTGSIFGGCTGHADALVAKVATLRLAASIGESELSVPRIEEAVNVLGSAILELEDWLPSAMPPGIPATLSVPLARAIGAAHCGVAQLLIQLGANDARKKSEEERDRLRKMSPADRLVAVLMPENEEELLTKEAQKKTRTGLREEKAVQAATTATSLVSETLAPLAASKAHLTLGRAMKALAVRRGELLESWIENINVRNRRPRRDDVLLLPTAISHIQTAARLARMQGDASIASFAWAELGFCGGNNSDLPNVAEPLAASQALLQAQASEIVKEAHSLIPALVERRSPEVAYVRLQNFLLDRAPANLDIGSSTPIAAAQKHLRTVSAFWRNSDIQQSSAVPSVKTVINSLGPNQVFLSIRGPFPAGYQTPTVFYSPIPTSKSSGSLTESVCWEVALQSGSPDPDPDVDPRYAAAPVNPPDEENAENMNLETMDEMEYLYFVMLARPPSGTNRKIQSSAAESKEKELSVREQRALERAEKRDKERQDRERTNEKEKDKENKESFSRLFRVALPVGTISQLSADWASASRVRGDGAGLVTACKKMSAILDPILQEMKPYVNGLLQSSAKPAAPSSLVLSPDASLDLLPLEGILQGILPQNCTTVRDFSVMSWIQRTKNVNSSRSDQTEKEVKEREGKRDRERQAQPSTTGALPPARRIVYVVDPEKEDQLLRDSFGTCVDKITKIGVDIFGLNRSTNDLCRRGDLASFPAFPSPGEWQRAMAAGPVFLFASRRSLFECCAPSSVAGLDLSSVSSGVLFDRPAFADEVGRRPPSRVAAPRATALVLTMAGMRSVVVSRRPLEPERQRSFISSVMGSWAGVDSGKGYGLLLAEALHTASNKPLSNRKTGAQSRPTSATQSESPRPKSGRRSKPDITPDIEKEDKKSRKDKRKDRKEKEKKEKDGKQLSARGKKSVEESEVDVRSEREGSLVEADKSVTEKEKIDSDSMVIGSSMWCLYGTPRVKLQ